MTLDKAISFGGVCLLIASCSSGEFSVEKPAGVPEDAWLVGGLDGWSWVDCRPTSEVHMECRVYNQKGEHSRTSFMRVCLNLEHNEVRGVEVSAVYESLIKLDAVTLFEYRPSMMFDRDNKDSIATKYYNLLGVDDNCRPASDESELREVARNPEFDK
jgi:hypothetical protein